MTHGDASKPQNCAESSLGKGRATLSPLLSLSLPEAPFQTQLAVEYDQQFSSEVQQNLPMESNAQSLPETIPRPVISTMAGQKDVLGVRLPTMEDELHHNAGQVQGELSHSLKNFDSQQRIPLTTEALPAR